MLRNRPASSNRDLWVYGGSERAFFYDDGGETFKFCSVPARPSARPALRLWMKTPVSSPVIIIGMHRSGTTMVTRLLARCGLFVGAYLESNCESRMFLSINNWIFRQSNAAWDYPLALRHLLSNNMAKSMVLEHLKFLLSTPYVFYYLGFRGYFRYTTLHRLSRPWGWKDPRNTFTLPFWLDLFPNAKVLHVYRHGVDVAESLRRRQYRYLSGSVAARAKYGSITHLAWHRLQFTNSLRVATLEGGFSLWEEYMQQARLCMSLVKDRVAAVSYEDFLLQPVDALAHVASFCGLNVPKSSVLRELVGSIKSSRAYAYKNDAELSSFAASKASQLAIYGYDV
jgi:hypothetical protein